MEALRGALGALQGGRFAEAARLAGPLVGGSGEARLLYALGVGGAGEVVEGVRLLEGVARAGARHPVHDLVQLLRRQGREGDAVAALRAAEALRPGDAGMGAALAELGDMAGAVACFRRGVALRPGEAAGWSNLGKALAAEGAFAEAEAAHGRAVGLDGGAQVRLNRALALLKGGRWAEGFAQWERNTPMPPGERLAPGVAVAGRTVVLVHEEGFGDTIQMLRFAAVLAARGARVVAWVPPGLVRVAARVVGVAAAVSMAEAAPVGLVCPMLALPHVLGVTPETVPGAPYLAAGGAAGRGIGVVWAGQARTGAQATDRARSLDPSLLRPLLGLPGMEFVSLQWGSPALPGLRDGVGQARDFWDTAEAIAGLAGVISVDTAVAHLAGAMGKPVLLLDRYDNCWRWLHGREDTPWYPTMRILRQRRPGDWAGVVTRAAALLSESPPIWPGRPAVSRG